MPCTTSEKQRRGLEKKEGKSLGKQGAPTLANNSTRSPSQITEKKRGTGHTLHQHQLRTCDFVFYNFAPRLQILIRTFPMSFLLRPLSQANQTLKIPPFNPRLSLSPSLPISPRKIAVLSLANLLEKILAQDDTQKRVIQKKSREKENISEQKKT